MDLMSLCSVPQTPRLLLLGTTLHGSKAVEIEASGICSHMRNSCCSISSYFSYTSAEDGCGNGCYWMAQLHEALVAAVQYGAVPRIQDTREDVEWKWKKTLGALEHTPIIIRHDRQKRGLSYARLLHRLLRITGFGKWTNTKWLKGRASSMMPEIQEVHLRRTARKFASGEAKPKAQSLPVLVRIVRLGRHENFEIGVPLAAMSVQNQALEGGKKKNWLDRSDRAEREKAMRDRCSEPQGDERVSQRSGSCLCA